MSNDLIQVSANEVTPYSDDLFGAVQSGQAFLPYLQLMTSNSAQCKAGTFATNHYARVLNNDFTDMGATVDVVVCSWRPMALLNEDDTIIVVHDPKVGEDGKPTGEFARIQEIADRPGLTGGMYGPQFLLWIPQTKEFMTYFMSSKTARRVAPAVKARMCNAATLGSRKIEAKSYTWFGPTCTACSTPIEAPDQEALMAEINKFTTPVDVVPERVEDGSRER